VEEGAGSSSIKNLHAMVVGVSHDDVHPSLSMAMPPTLQDENCPSPEH
jgi:hypothetical protein